jgi:hypothetical protein
MVVIGFSASDIIEGVKIIATVISALKEVGGAASEYRRVIAELEGLERVLRQLSALKPTKSNIEYVNSIKAAALMCEIPLRDFLQRSRNMRSRWVQAQGENL